MKKSTVRINLMPHREVKREIARKDFNAKLALAAILGVGCVFLAGTAIEKTIESQRQRNTFIQTEIKTLDSEIAAIRDLQKEIDALKARQKAVEDLQADRNLPIYLFDEMVRYVPEGVHLKSLKQEGLKVSLVGVAQTQERVSEVLRNFSSQSQWVEAPELSEIRSVATTRPNEKLFEFTLTVMLKRQGKSAAQNASTNTLSNVALPAARP